MFSLLILEYSRVLYVSGHGDISVIVDRRINIAPSNNDWDEVGGGIRICRVSITSPNRRQRKLVQTHVAPVCSECMRERR